MLLPKPKDWGSHISVSGFFSLPVDDGFTPPSDLLEFLEAGDPPIYIGFGSIVVDNPKAMTSLILEAIQKPECAPCYPKAGEVLEAQM